jgi:two-component system chemotaxis response regulator CheB
VVHSERGGPRAGRFVDEAIRTALRLIEERIVLLEKISTEAGQAGRTNMAEQFRMRSQDFRERASTLRAVITDMTQVP